MSDIILKSSHRFALFSLSLSERRVSLFCAAKLTEVKFALCFNFKDFARINMGAPTITLNNGKQFPVLGLGEEKVQFST